MPDVEEVFRMATEKVRPDEGFVDRQHDQQRRRIRSRKTGALVLVAVLGVAAAAFAIRLGVVEDRSEPATQPSPASPAVADDRDFILDLSTGTKTTLPSDIVGAARDPREYALAPDGTTLAWSAEPMDGQPRQIYVASIDGSGTTWQATHDPVGAGVPAWSPDGSKIAYEGYGHGTVRNLFTINVKTFGTKQVTSETADVYGTQFTPDGSAIVFAGGSKGHGLRLAPIEGGKQVLVVGGGGTDGDAGAGSFSPDGSMVTYPFGEVGAPADRWLANADGTDARPLVDGGPFLECSVPGAWSPDSRRIVCSDLRQVVVIDVATGETTEVAVGEGAIWLDNHTLLVDV